jgi:hypothetical protein
MLAFLQYVSLCVSFSRICWHASKWSSISFSHWQCPFDGDFSFPRFVGPIILSLWQKLLCCCWFIKPITIMEICFSVSEWYGNTLPQYWSGGPLPLRFRHLASLAWRYRTLNPIPGLPSARSYCSKIQDSEKINLELHYCNGVYLTCDVNKINKSIL